MSLVSFYSTDITILLLSVSLSFSVASLSHFARTHINPFSLVSCSTITPQSLLSPLYDISFISRIEGEALLLRVRAISTSRTTSFSAPSWPPHHHYAPALITTRSLTITITLTTTTFLLIYKCHLYRGRLSTLFLLRSASSYRPTPSPALHTHNPSRHRSPSDNTVKS